MPRPEIKSKAQSLIMLTNCVFSSRCGNPVNFVGRGILKLPALNCPAQSPLPCRRAFRRPQSTTRYHPQKHFLWSSPISKKIGISPLEPFVEPSLSNMVMPFPYCPSNQPLLQDLGVTYQSTNLAMSCTFTRNERGVN